jgi:RNA polymerase subunit RPABC4/transcription elongation factor Spt4
MSGSGLSGASAFGSVHGALSSPALGMARNLALFLAVVFWLGLAFWTNRDARRRTGDPLLVGTATALGLVPYVGPLIYLLFRPPETLADIRERDLGLQALEERLAEHAALHCPVCRAEVGTDFRVCPVCTTRLKQACAQCSAPLERLWQVCPTCGTPTTVPELGTPELDAALAAEASARGKSTANAVVPS